MPIHSSNVGREIVSSWCRNWGPITCLQDGHQRDTSCQGCRSSNPPERAQRHMYLTNTENFLYSRRNGFSTDRPMLPIVTQKRRSHSRSIWLLPKGFSMSLKSLQIKSRAKINIGVRLNMNLRGKMTQTICLATRQGNENSSMTLKKKVLAIST